MNGKIYFVSDFHFGIPDYKGSLERERKLIRWLGEASKDAEEIYLMGDIFDFWFEYKTVVPKGFTRLLGKIAELTDAGIPVHLFRGNHDIWAFSYLAQETGIILHRQPEIRTWNNKKFYLVHGDGLGPGDRGYKLLKRIFEFPFHQWLFRWLHPDIGVRLGLYFSGRSRYANIAREKKNADVRHIPTERLYEYGLRILESDPTIDYFIFGHHHLPTERRIGEKSHFILIGDWITHFSYVVFDGTSVVLKYYT